MRLAARACDLGRVASNGQPAKASRDVRVGDLLQVKSYSGDFQVEGLLLIVICGIEWIVRVSAFTLFKAKPPGASALITG